MTSPDLLLKERKGHCFELATLLCSLLIGHGFDAFVVSGYASREMTKNDQCRVVCPAIEKKRKERELEELKELEDNPVEIIPESKYKLRESINLKSNFLKQLDDEEHDRHTENEAKVAAEDEERIRKEEALPVDELLNKRVHSWILVQNGKDVFFIEPSTGFRHKINDPAFVAIESIWNHENYMVNKQNELIHRIDDLNWNLLDRAHWERLLDVDSDFPEAINYCPKYLDMPLSWVRKLFVSLNSFEDRFPEQQKVISYKRAIHEQFAVYKQFDGVVERIKTFETLDYQRPREMWEYFRNRVDFLTERRTDYKNREITELFSKGRKDALKTCKSSSASGTTVEEYIFFYKLRFDCLKRIEMTGTEIKEFYRNREDW